MFRDNLHSENPLERARAAVRVADAGDAASVPRLVDLLEDRDSAVRMYAILALRRMCGTDYGYEYYAPEPARAEAVQRWRRALRDGEVAVGGHGAGDASRPSISVNGAARGLDQAGTDGSEGP